MSKSNFFDIHKDWEIVIGLEVHAQISTTLKLFSNGSAKFGANPNESLDLLDIGLPGTLPTINALAIDKAIKTGLALNAKINKKSIFDRKNYFYPDLPLGYQISQFKDPIVGNGFLDLDLDEGKSKRIRIERLHLEQDAGKSLHDQSPTESFIDYNRAGVALMEIVSFPDLSNWEEAGTYFSKLRNILRFVNTCDGNMEEGSLRADANVSVRKKGEKLGTRTEIKNLNSVKNLMKAIEYEANRQVNEIKKGNNISQETRLFDVGTGKTRSMRSKEDAHDYRYFPDPDLLPLEVSDDFVEKLKLEIPELPDEKKKRFIEKFKLTPYEATILVSDIETSNYFENVIKKSDVKLTTNWIIGELFAALNEKNLEITECPISAGNLSKLINLIKDGTISGKIAKIVFEYMMEGDKDPKKIVDEKGLKQESDPKALEALIDKVIDDNRDKATEYKSGKVKLFGFFVGQVMKVSGGKANPQLVNEILKKKL